MSDLLIVSLSVLMDETPDPTEVKAVHAHLETYSAPANCVDEIEAWEREEQRSLLPVAPPDAQLDAALALFRGERPGAYVAQVVK